MLKKEENEDFFTLEDFQKNRSHKEAMEEFATWFLPCVVGQTEYIRRQAMMPISSIATVSDEGFVMLVLENIWETWIKRDLEEFHRKKVMAGLQQRTGVAASSNSGVTETSASSSNLAEKGAAGKSEKANYNCGKFTQNSTNAKKYSGWTDACLERFHTYCQEIKKFRTDYPDFDEEFMADRKKEWLDSKKGKKRGNTDDSGPAKKVKIYVDLED